MPTPTGDSVTSALLNAFSGRRGGGNEDVSELDAFLSSGSKQALTTDIEYELAENQFANSLTAMKTKYLCFSSKPLPKKNGISFPNTSFHNGNGVKNGTTNGMKNGNGMNGGKVNPDSILPEPKFVMFPPEKVVLGWDKKEPVGAGMHNMGNTCYLNSILQALFHVPALVHWLSNDLEHRKKCEQENGPNCGDCITCALAKTLNVSRNQETMRPELITSKLRMICRSLSIGAEEDAHEFMRYLLENVERGFLKRFPQKKFDPYSRETTPINQIFGGYMRTEVTCRNCGNVSTTFQHFQDLLLDIRKVSKVEEALDQYFSKEVLDGPNAYRCEKCKQATHAIKKYSIERPPKVLCVQLKRFTGTGGKITKSIDMQESLSLHKYLNVASQYASNGPLEYKLIAMVTHSGQSAGNGHYTAIAKTSSASYYLFDDASVRQIPLPSVLNTNAYILFFEMEVPRVHNSQRENQSISKGMPNKILPNKAMPSTVTSNGSSNGSSCSLFAFKSEKKWDRVASPTQTSVQPRLIHPTSKKGKLQLEKSQEKANSFNRPEAENKPGFIGPRLAMDLKRTVEGASMPPLDENPLKKRLVDGTVKVADEKKNGKMSTSLVPYDDEDSSCSESSGSPSSGQEANQSLAVKATTPGDWQVTVSPSVRSSPSLSSEGSTKTNWNVTQRPSPNVQKSNPCSSDTEIDSRVSNTGDNSLSRADSLDRTVGKTAEKGQADLPGVQKLPLSPACLLTNGTLREKFYKKRNDAENANDRISNDSRDNWKDRSISKDYSYRNSYKNEDCNDSHSSSWRNGSNLWNGGPNRNQSFNRTQVSSNGFSSERGMHNGNDSKNSWNKDSSDTVSHLSRMSHTGFNGRISTWNNERSNLDRSVEEEQRLSRKRKRDDYEDEMDRGRAKKMRPHREYPVYNHFDAHQNRQMKHSKYPYSYSRNYHKHNGYNNNKKNHYHHHQRNNHRNNFKRMHY